MHVPIFMYIKTKLNLNKKLFIILTRKCYLINGIFRGKCKIMEEEPGYKLVPSYNSFRGFFFLYPKTMFTNKSNSNQVILIAPYKNPCTLLCNIQQVLVTRQLSLKVKWVLSKIFITTCDECLLNCLMKQLKKQ